MKPTIIASVTLNKITKLGFIPSDLLIVTDPGLTTIAIGSVIRKDLADKITADDPEVQFTPYTEADALKYERKAKEEYYTAYNYKHPKVIFTSYKDYSLS